mgnify:CR=1 FL=1
MAVTFELSLTGVTVEVTDRRETSQLRHAVIALYDHGKPLGVHVERPLPDPVAERAQPGDRWTVALQREVAL